MAVAVHGFKPTIWSRRCRLRSFPHPDSNLLDLDPSPPPKFPRSLSTPCFPTTADDPGDRLARIEIVAGRRSLGTHALVVEAAIAMASGARPVPASGGLGGAYYLRNRAGNSFAVVKPVDEEPLAVSFLGRPGSRRSVRAGETGFREVAAYLLDHGGFSDVPPTALIKISYPAFPAAAGSPPRKVASIQRFVPHDFDAGELGPSRFSIASVHRIGILDVRILNIDRHAGNILVKKRDGYGGYCNDAAATELVPIDHGLCLPELLDDPYFEWLHWPQAAVPFSDLEADYISALDPYKDAELLREELPALREPAIRSLVLCTTFLKRAAAAGLCLADIGDMMTRELSGVEEGPSALEALCKQAEDSMNHTTARSPSPSSSSDDGSSDGSTEYQFNMDCDDDGVFSESRIKDVMDVPMLLTSKTPVRSAGDEHGTVLAPLREEEDCDGEDGGGEPTAAVAITKSVSFSAADFNYEGGGGSGSSRCISFKGLSEEVWGLFLERFEELLQVAFEARKSMGLKQRLGTSCDF